MITISRWCKKIEILPIQVVTKLKGEEAELDTDTPKVHKMPSRRRTYSEELFDAEEYNATRYLSDLSRHKEIALDFRAGGDVAELPDKVNGGESE